MFLTPTLVQAGDEALPLPSDWWHAVDHRAGQAKSGSSESRAQMNTGLPPAAWSEASANPRTAPDTIVRASAVGDDAVSNLSLEEAIRQGLAINPAVRAAASDTEAAGTDVDIAEWGYFPSVDLSAGPEEFPFEDLGYDVSATQMLYDWGKTKSQVAQASAAQREARRQLGVAEEEASLDIAEAYLDVLTAQRQLETVQGYVDDLGKLETLTQDRGSNGYTDRSEQGRVSLDLAQARDDLASQRGTLMDARQQFRVLVGVPPEGLETPHPADLTRRLEQGGALDDWIVAAPGYRKAVASAEQAQAELDETQASLKPQLNLEGSLQRRQIGGELENDSVIGFRLRMDTLQGLANFQRPDAARQRLEAARYRVDDQRREIRRSVLTLIENAEVYGDRQQALQSQIEQSATVGKLYDDQFSVGLRDVNDLLTIRQEAYTARRQLIDLESQQKRIQYRAASQLGLMYPLVSGRLGDDTP
ncbi:TolC family protein [Salinicola rhizosphaerae]|nr:TolC family protein [Salinicola rhizosphaerae]